MLSLDYPCLPHHAVHLMYNMFTNYVMANEWSVSPEHALFSVPPSLKICIDQRNISDADPTNNIGEI